MPNFMPRLSGCVLIAVCLVFATARAVDYGAHDRLESVIPIDNVECLVLRDSMMFAVAGDSLTVMDLAAPDRPAVLAVLDTGHVDARRLAVEDSLIILMYDDATQLILRPERGAVVLAATLPGGQNFAHCGDRLFIGGADAAALVYDISTPDQPAMMPAVDLGGRLLGGTLTDVLVARRETFPDGAGYREYLIGLDADGDLPAAVPDTLGSVSGDNYGTVRTYSALLSDRGGFSVLISTRYWDALCGLSTAVYSSSALASLPSAGLDLVAGEIAPSVVANSWYTFTRDNIGGCGQWGLAANPVPDGPAATTPFRLSARQGMTLAADGDVLVVARAGATDGEAGAVYVSRTTARQFAQRDPMWAIGGDAATAWVGSPDRSQGQIAWLLDEVRCYYEGPKCEAFEAWTGQWSLQTLTTEGDPVIERFVLDGHPDSQLRLAADVRAFGLGNDTILDPRVDIRSGDGSTVLGTVHGVGSRALARYGDLVLAAGWGGLTLLDCTIHDQPRILWSRTDLRLSALAVDGETVLTAGHYGGIEVLTANADTTFSSVASIVTGGRVTTMHTEGSVLWHAVANRVVATDVSDPADPIQLSSHELLADVRGFCVSGPFLYAACGAAGVLVYELDGLGGATYLGGDPRWQALDVVIADGRLIVTEADGVQALPLQEGDPLPSFLQSFDGRIQDGGAVELVWTLQGEAEVRVVRVVGGEVVVLPQAIAGDGRFVAVDHQPVSWQGVYSYRLSVRNASGTWSQLATLDLPGPIGLPGITSVIPNPFNPTVRIGFRLGRADRVELAVFDVRGVRMRTLYKGVMQAGSHELAWNGRTDDGATAAAGSYFCRLATGTSFYTQKMILLK